MLHRPQLAPLGLKLFQRARQCPPILHFAFFRIRQHHGAESGNQLVARFQVFLSRRFQLGQMRSHRQVSGLQRDIETLPQRTVGGAAEFVEFLPAFAQILDGVGMRLDRQFFGTAGFRQHFRLHHEILAYPSAAPVLPALESRHFGLHGLHTHQQFGIRASRLRSFIQLAQVFDRFRKMTSGQSTFSLDQYRLKRFQLGLPDRFVFFADLFLLFGGPRLPGVGLLALPLFEARIEGRRHTCIADRQRLPGRTLRAVGRGRQVFQKRQAHDGVGARLQRRTQHLLQIRNHRTGGCHVARGEGRGQ